MYLKGFIANAFSRKYVLSAIRTFSKLARSNKACMIINFHRFYESPEDILLKGPSVHTHIGDFEEFLYLLSQRFDFISMNRLVEHLESGEPFESDSVTITMDDGYEDNLTLAAPVLRKYRVPATVYIATQFIGSNELLPMDSVDDAIRRTKKHSLDWDILGDEPLMLSNDEECRGANTTVGKVLKKLPAREMKKKLNELYELLDVGAPEGANNMLDWSQVRQLIDQGIEIGSHGVSHCLMTQLPEEEAIDELYASKETIREKTGYDPSHFAFPNGQAEDFSEKLRYEARSAGYRSVVSVVRGPIRPGLTDAYDMPRLGLIGGPKEMMMYIERMLFTH